MRTARNGLKNPGLALQFSWVVLTFNIAVYHSRVSNITCTLLLAINLFSREKILTRFRRLTIALFLVTHSDFVYDLST